ncbi:unnamed protein product, partial [Urochloa humidicola]
LPFLWKGCDLDSKHRNQKIHSDSREGISRLSPSASPPSRHCSAPEKLAPLPSPLLPLAMDVPSRKHESLEMTNPPQPSGSSRRRWLRPILLLHQPRILVFYRLGRMNRSQEEQVMVCYIILHCYLHAFRVEYRVHLLLIWWLLLKLSKGYRMSKCTLWKCLLLLCLYSSYAETATRSIVKTQAATKNSTTSLINQRLLCSLKDVNIQIISCIPNTSNISFLCFGF